jgi:hypothetical protein
MLKYPRKLVIPPALRDRIENNILNTTTLFIFLPDIDPIHVHAHVYNTSYIYSEATKSLHVLTKGCDEFDDYYFTHKIYHDVVFSNNHYGSSYFRNVNNSHHYETIYKYIDLTKTIIYLNKPYCNGVLVSNYHKISYASTDPNSEPYRILNP